MALPEHTRQPAPNSEKSSGKKKKFESNNKYFSICTYVVATFTICLIIFKFINNWRDMQIYTSSILSTLSPFLIAFLIAYFINPLVNRIDHILFQPDSLSEVCKAAQVPFSAAGLCHCHRLYCPCADICYSTDC